MSVVVLGDTHFGVRQDSVSFLEHQEWFFTKFLFPAMQARGDKIIIQVGDFFDRQKGTSTEILDRVKKNILDVAQDLGFTWSIIVGNHDCPFKNTVKVNAPEILLRDYDNINVFSKPTTIQLDGVQCHVIPWIAKDEEDAVLSFLRDESRQVPICLGHFQLLGFEMDPGAFCVHGHDRKLLNRYEKVLSGHFHVKSQSEDKKIVYLGTPYQITWADHGTPRGFHFFDPKTLELEFVPNPRPMFQKFAYDDRLPENQIFDVLGGAPPDFENLEGVYVKLLVLAKTNPATFDKVHQKFLEARPGSLKVIEDVVPTVPGAQETSISVDDTGKLMDLCVDELTLDFEPITLKNLLRELHVEALAQE